MKPARSRINNDVDRYIGQRVRARRLVVGFTQKQLADEIGVTFQQIQKYESGADRISSSRLLQIAVALKTTPAYFFPVTAAVVDDGTNATDDEMSKLVDRPDTIKLLRAFKSIVGAKRRADVIELVEALRRRYFDGGGR
jgi:transcriptional regulator with XRE-family HTH domain